VQPYFTKFFTAGTNKSSDVEPIICQYFDGNFLALVIAGECVVSHNYIDASTVAVVLVAARAPVLPKSDLTTRPFLPH